MISFSYLGDLTDIMIDKVVTLSLLYVTSSFFLAVRTGVGACLWQISLGTDSRLSSLQRNKKSQHRHNIVEITGITL